MVLYQNLYCVANENVWNGLPAEIQEGIREAWETKRQQILDYYAAEESKSLETLASDVMLSAVIF